MKRAEQTRNMKQAAKRIAKQSNDSGIALLTTLWVIAILSLLITGYLYETHLDWRISRRAIEKTQAEYAAKAGIAQFEAILSEDDDSYDDLQEAWGETLQGQLEDPLGAGRNYSYTLDATDTNAMIDINSADQSMIASLLESAGAPEETRAELAQNIIAARDERPFLTTGDLARAQGMTNEILYGAQQTAAQEEGEEAQPATPLINLIGVYSVDKNTQADGSERTNISSANANTLRQELTDDNGEQLLSQNEANAFVSYRDNNEFESIGNLFDIPAVTQETLNNVRDQLSTDGSDDTVNINSANANALANVNGLDQGTAQAIVRYRESNGNYENVDDIQNAPVFTRDEIRQIADKTAVSDDDMLSGVVNINTASADTLGRLPGMNGQRAQDIVNRRQTQAVETGGGRGGQQGGEETAAASNPFRSVGDLLNIDSIDEETFKSIANLVTYRAQAFQIAATGIDPTGAEAAVVNAVMDRSGDEINLRFWRVE